MSTRDRSPPALDLSSIELPTDRLTFGMIRKAEPNLVDTEFLRRSGLLSSEPFFSAAWERALAAKSFAKVAGISDPYPDHNRDEIVEMLDSGYRACGLSSSREETEALARTLEGRSMRQARNRAARGR